MKLAQLPPYFTEVPVQSQESERSCICVLRVSILVLERERERMCLLSVVSYLIHSCFFCLIIILCPLYVYVRSTLG